MLELSLLTTKFSKASAKEAIPMVTGETFLRVVITTLANSKIASVMGMAAKCIPMAKLRRVCGLMVSFRMSE